MTAWKRYGNLVELLRVRAQGSSSRGYTFEADAQRDDRALSFAQLDVRARAVAAQLQDEGLAGKVALLCYPPGLDFLVGLFGSLYAGMIAVPTNVVRVRRGDSRFAGIAADAGAGVALTCGASRDLDRLLAEAPQLRKLRWLDSTQVADDCATRWRQPALGRDDPAVLQYTSGSTGNPKGVVLTHSCLLHNLHRMYEVLGLHTDVRAVCWLPPFHDMGLIGNLLQAVYSDGRQHMMAPVTFLREPLRWLQAITRHRAFVSGGPNFAFEMCVKRAARTPPEELARLDLRSWQVAYIGAEPILPGTLARFVQTFAAAGYGAETYFPCYGLAEATLMVSGGPRRLPPRRFFLQTADLENHRVVAAGDSKPAKEVIACGRPLKDMEVMIVDPNTAKPCLAGQIGEIWVAGPSVAAGYWQRPEESAQTFAATHPEAPSHRYLRTGDLGFLHDGELYVTGRIKDLIIIRGRNIYPQDLEETIQQEVAALRGHPAAAFAIAGEATEKIVLVQEVERGYVRGQAADLFRQVRQVIAEQFEVEVHALVLIRTGTISKSSSGKVRRRECQRRFVAGELEVVEQIAAEEAKESSPPSANGFQEIAERDIQAWLIARLAQKLKVPAAEIDVNRPFAAYGLDSEAMVVVAADLEKWLGRFLSPTLLYDAPTIASLSRRLAGAERGAPSAEREAPSAHSSRSALGAPRSALRPLEPIAIIGLGCRFPQANSPDEFWRLLCEGRHGIRELPQGRWQRRPHGLATTSAGYLADVESFDLQFFGISPREATFVDPQHRLLLEVAWEALEYGGISPDRLAGANVGVFMGISTSDYGWLLLRSGQSSDAYAGAGNARTMAANRLSYHLDLHGPSVAVDTACSSSLVAVHLACQALRTGDCEMALAGGVNLILSPELSEALAQAQLLSPTGLCKAFDAAADGYVRGEGGGVVVLKRLSDALDDRDMILAVIEGSAVSQDGRTNGITAPNGPSQAELLRRALRQARRTPEAISYIEAHGTGTALGDPIEFDALASALGEAGTPCALGAVKTNVGHLEAAAGIAGLIKVVLQLQERAIAPVVHLAQPNPRLRLAGSRFHLPRQVEPWTTAGKPRVAGVSSFGFGGTIAHVVVAEAPANKTSEVSTDFGSLSHSPERDQFLLPLSAKSNQAVVELASRYRDALLRPELPTLGNICYTAGFGRAHFDYRLAIRGGTPTELRESLEGFLAGKADARTQVGTSLRFPGPQIAWVFTGNGGQYAGMAQGLAASCPVFRESLDGCDKILRNDFPISLSDLLAGRAAEHCLEDGPYTQPVLFALEYALAQTWRELGIEPAAVMGHSLGEYVAACVAGVFSLEDALRLVLERGRAMQELCSAGAMLACFAPVEKVMTALAPLSDALALAAVNGPANVVMAGAAAAIAQAANLLKHHDVATHPLRVNRAFHSALIEPALPALDQVAGRIRHQPARLPLVSNVSGTFHAGAVTADYWARHARQTVQFVAGLDALNQMGITHYLEIGPDAVLCRLGKAYPPTAAAHWLPSLQRQAEDWNVLLGSLGRLYVDGVAIDWQQLDRGYARRRVVLPTYPFQRQRHWIENAEAASVPEKTRAEAPAELPANWCYEIAWVPQSHWAQRLPRQALGDLVAVDRLAEDLGKTSAELHARHNLEQFASARIGFDQLTTRYVLETFDQLGWAPPIGTAVRVEDLGRDLRVLPKYQRLLRRLLALAAEDGWLHQRGDQVVVVGRPVLGAADAAQKSLLEAFPVFQTELTLAHRCATHMAAVMQGISNPLQVLFGEEVATLTRQLYETSPFAQIYNELLREAIRAAVAALPADRPIRILELGAGTGGTSTHVVPVLPPDRVEYVFSDVSSLFLARAQESFRDFPFLQYRLLDLEKDPAGQGFADEQFDLILAANVVHATPDVRQSLRHVQRLLVPGGLLFLLENVQRRRLLDIIFGLTEGWWRFTDTDLRPDYPLLPADRWLQVLADEGFDQATILPGTGEQEDQAALIARKATKTSEILRDFGSLNSPNGDLSDHSLVIFADQAGLGQAVAKRLQHDGDIVVFVEPGDRYAGPQQSRCRIRSGHEPDYAALFDDLRAQNPLGLLRVIYLWGLSASAPAPQPALPWSEEGLLYLAKELARRGPSLSPVSLALVTRGGAAAGDRAQVLLDQAMLHDLARAVQGLAGMPAIERIDLDPRHSFEMQVQCLWAALDNADRDNLVAYRGDQRFVPRLQRQPAPGACAAAYPYDPAGLYLIAGQPGGRRQQAAEAAVAGGARRLVLVQPVQEVTDQTADSADLEVLRHSGAEIHAYNVAPHDAGAWGRFLDKLHQEVPGHIQGVIHLAEELLLEKPDIMDVRTLSRTFATDRNVGRRLAELGQDDESFYLFMATTGWTGNKSRGPVFRHESCLGTALVQSRRRQGRAAGSVHWAAEIEAAATAAPTQPWCEAALPSWQPVLGQLGRWLADRRPTVLLPYRWQAFFEAFPAAAREPFFARLAQEQKTIGGQVAGVDRQTLLAALPAERPKLLEQFLRAEFASITGLYLTDAEIDKPLHSFGLDSMMAIQLRNRVEAELQISLSLVDFLKGLSLAQIVHNASQEIAPDNDSGPPPVELPAETLGSLNVDNLEKLSEGELDSLLQTMLDQVQP